MNATALSRAMVVSFAIIGAFAMFTYAFKPNDLIVLLNGLLVGSLVSVAFAFSRLMFYAVFDGDQYTRSRQYAIGVMLCWVVIAIGTSVSIYVNAINLPVPVFLAVAFARFLAIIAAILQVTSPDFGLGVMYGRDRKMMYLSMVIGAAVAFAAIVAQGV